MQQKIFFQWEKWAYSHYVWLQVAKKFNIDEKNVIWVFSFKDLFESVVNNKWIWIVPIENSYAWSVHENFYHLSKFPIKIIWEYYLEIKHCLLGLTDDIKKIKKAYSHYQALMQCEKFLENHNIKPVVWWDTATSAKYIMNQKNPSYACIASKLRAKLYWLNILKENIADQSWNTTRFFVVIPEEFYTNEANPQKTSIVFSVKDMPAVLYKCLGAFATRNINLTKIESLPTRKWKFEYMFWLDFENSWNDLVNWALNELSFFAKDIKILWSYSLIENID